MIANFCSLALWGYWTMVVKYELSLVTVANRSKEETATLMLQFGSVGIAAFVFMLDSLVKYEVARNGLVRLATACFVVS